MTDTSLYDAAGAILAATLDLMPQPAARAFVVHGDPAADCDQLTCGWSGLTAAALNPNSARLDPADPRAPRVLIGTFSLVRFRCAPAIKQARGAGKPTIPSAAEQDAFALEVAGEALTVFTGLRQAVRTGQLFDRCQAVAISPMNAISAEGGMAGWQISIDAQINIVPPSVP